LASVRVEGKYSSAQIIDAIKTFNAQKNPPQVLVVMRGGGSLEDLQSYNQEDVVRAIFASKIPTIAAIGHDRDVPLVCLAADTYTSTPTAAAVAINNSWAALDYDLPLLEQNLINSFGQILNQVKRKIEINNQNLQLSVKELVNLALKASQTLKYISGQLKTRMDEVNSQSAYFAKTIFSGFTQMTYSFNNQIATFQKILELNNPERQLALGYSIITLKNGKVVKSIDEASVDQEIITTLKDGKLISKITGKAQNDS
jgi:exodeoxyribonuclease VII large subunit